MWNDFSLGAFSVGDAHNINKYKAHSVKRTKGTKTLIKVYDLATDFFLLQISDYSKQNQPFIT